MVSVPCVQFVTNPYPFRTVFRFNVRLNTLRKAKFGGGDYFGTTNRYRMTKPRTNSHKNTASISPDKFYFTYCRHGDSTAILDGEISNNIQLIRSTLLVTTTVGA